MKNMNIVLVLFLFLIAVILYSVESNIDIDTLKFNEINKGDIYSPKSAYQIEFNNLKNDRKISEELHTYFVRFVLPLLVALISVYWAHKLTIQSKRKRMIELYKYMLDYLCTASEQQKENFKSLVSKLEEKKSYTIYSLKAKTDFNVSMLNKIPLEIVLDKVTKKRSKLIIRNLLNSINILDTISKRYVIDHERMAEKFNQYLKDWNYNIDNIRKTYDNFLVYFKSTGEYKKGVDIFFDDFNDIYKEYSEQDNYLDFYVTCKFLLNPLYDTCLKHSANINAFQVLNYVISSRAAFKNYETAKNVYIDIFKDYTKNIETSIGFINQNIDDIFK